MPAQLLVSRDTPIRISLSSAAGDGYFPYWSVRDLANGAVQCALDFNGAFGTGGTVTLQVSLNGTNWVSSGSTITGAGLTSNLDLDGWAFLRPKLTTVGTGSPAGHAWFTLLATGSLV